MVRGVTWSADKLVLLRNVGVLDTAGLRLGLVTLAAPAPGAPARRLYAAEPSEALTLSADGSTLIRGEGPRVLLQRLDSGETAPPIAAGERAAKLISVGADAALLGETCNVCLTAADCAMGLLCAPVIDPGAMMMGVSGKRDCVAPGSVADDAMCPDDDTGDAACMSGHCGAVDVMGFLTLHLCGACEADADCGPGEVCQPAAFDMTNGPTGARCV